MQTDSVISMIGGTPVPISVCRMMWKVGNSETHRRAQVTAAAASNVAILEAQFKRMFDTST